jgi:hypothetical protein
MPEYSWLGDKVKSGWHSLKGGVKKVFQNPIFQTVAPIALDYFFPGAGRALGTWLGASAGTANVVGNAAIGAGMGALADGKKGALSGAISGGIRGGGGAMAGKALGVSGKMGNALGTALLQGASSSLQGGSFAPAAVMGGLQGYFQAPEVASLTDSAEAAAVPQIDPATGMAVEPMGIQGDAPLNDLDAKIRAGNPRATMAKPQPGASWGVTARKYALPIMGGLALASALSGRHQSTVGKPIPNQPGFDSPLTKLPFNRNSETPAIDYFTYGQTANPNPGEQQFFGDNAVPQPGLAQGGLLQSEHMPAVKGPGSGRDDHIPANLSDGEYVMDAETVALLGDGSGDEGARRLDEMRKNLRKHKAQGLSKGTHSPDAKRPEEYAGIEDYAKGGKVRNVTALFNKEGRIVHPGEKVTDFRGTEWIVTGHEPPRSEGSTGRVRVHHVDDQEGPESSREFYPKVMGLEIRKPELKKNGGRVDLAKGGMILRGPRKRSPGSGGGFQVRRIRVDGQPSHIISPDYTGRKEFPREEAEAHAENMIRLNDGVDYKVYGIGGELADTAEDELLQEMLKHITKGDAE